MIKKFYMALLVSLSFFIFTTTVFAANITNVRWGSQDNGNLRVVVDCDSATLANVYTQGENAVLKVDSKLATNVATDYKVKNPLAKKLTLKKDGDQTLIYIPLEVNTAQIDYKVFTLKKDPVTNKPNRIVLDLFKKAGSSAKLTKEISASSKENEKITTTTIKLENVAAKKVPEKKVPIVLKSGSKTIKLEKVSETTKVISNNDAVYKPLTKDNSNTTTNVSNSSVKYTKQEVPIKTTKANIKVLSKNSSAPSSNFTTDSSRFKPLSKETAVKPKTTTAKNFKTVPLTKVQERAAKWKALNSKSVSLKDEVDQGKLKTIKLNKEKSNNNSHKFRDLVAASGNSSARSDSLKGKIIVIDPGHGGNDPGAIGLNGTKEKDITLSVAVKVYHDLVDKGATVYLTRWTDTEVANPDSTDSEELQARVNIAKWKKADAFISLHVNASTKRSVGGIATYYYPKTWKDGKFAKAIQDQVTANLGLADLGIREANFYVNKRSGMTSSLVEMGFISNAKEERLLNSNWFRGKLADLISQGIDNYFK